MHEQDFQSLGRYILSPRGITTQRVPKTARMLDVEMGARIAQAQTGAIALLVGPAANARLWSSAIVHPATDHSVSITSL